MKRINGTVTPSQSMGGSLQYYTVYAKSPMAYSDPSPNPMPSEEITRMVNIYNTGELVDQSQKNFEILFQSIGLRALPIISGEVVPVGDLTIVGAPRLTGEGFMWKFAVEQNSAFTDFDEMNPVGLLIKELDGVIISSGVRITTVSNSQSGTPLNMEFLRTDNL